MFSFNLDLPLVGFFDSIPPRRTIFCDWDMCFLFFLRCFIPFFFKFIFSGGGRRVFKTKYYGFANGSRTSQYGYGSTSNACIHRCY